MKRLLLTVHIGALGLWGGLLLATGAAAATTFPVVKAMNPSAPEFAQYTGEHWRLIAGRVANTFFVVADIGQLVLAGAALLTLVGLGFSKAITRSSAAIVWVGCLALSVMALSYQLLVLAPRMASNLKKYWDAARAGQNATAEEFRLAFDADHPTASGVLIGLAVLAVVTMVAALWQSVETQRAN